MNATKYSFDLIASFANEVARYRATGESAGEAVRRVMFMNDEYLQVLVQMEVERRDRY